MKFQQEQLTLYAITDREACGTGEQLLANVRAAVEGGATMIQLRDKVLKGEELEAEAVMLLGLCRSLGVPLIINDDPLLAQKIGADGVHVGQEDMAAREARRILGPDGIVGVTAKTPEQALRAAADGADYLGSGAVFGSHTKAGAKTMSRETLLSITRVSPVPVVAIGGITAENAMELRGSGVAGISVIGSLFRAADVRAAAVELRRIAEELR